MKQKQFSDEPIIGLLKEAEAGAVVTELCRKHGMSSATYCAWGQVWRGGGIRRERMRALEEENARLKRLLADTMLDNAGRKDLLFLARLRHTWTAFISTWRKPSQKILPPCSD